MSEPPELEPGSRAPNLREARRRLAARSRELDVLQSMGRRAAEARVPLDLFATVLAVLDRTHELDLAFVCYEWDDARVADLFLARPFAEEYLNAVLLRASRFLDWAPLPAIEPRRHELPGFDGARGSRPDFREQDLLLLPLIRRGQPAACLLVVPTDEPEEAQLRLLYSASNQISLHLERIQTVREAEHTEAVDLPASRGALGPEPGVPRVLQYPEAADQRIDAPHAVHPPRRRSGSWARAALGERPRQPRLSPAYDSYAVSVTIPASASGSSAFDGTCSSATALFPHRRISTFNASSKSSRSR